MAGAGPAGCATALGLTRAGFTVLVLDPEPEPRRTPGETLAPAATGLLQDLGLLDAFLATSPLPSPGNRSAWGRDGQPMDRDFLAEGAGSGWHLDRASFDRMLRRAAVAAGARLETPAAIGSIERGAADWTVRLDTGQGPRTVTTRWLVDATGRSSALGRQLGARRQQLDSLLGIVAWLASPTPAEDARTLVEATRHGWWYAALLPGGDLVAAYMTEPGGAATRTAAASVDGWLAALDQAPLIRSLIQDHGYEVSEGPRAWPAATSFLDPLVGPGWLAVGDAAISYDPISSHGIGSALAAGMAAASAIQAQAGGVPDALGVYRELQRTALERYLWTRRMTYAEEQRFRTPFWTRQQDQPVQLP